MDLFKKINHPLGYSKFDMYDQCQRKYDVIYVSKICGDTNKHSSAYSGQDEHKQLELYCKGELAANEANLIQDYLEVADKIKSIPGEKFYEQQVAITKDLKLTEWFAKENVWLRIIRDVTIVNGNQGFVLDWKTGKKRGELEFQMEMYAFSLFLERPEIDDVTTMLYYLKDKSKSTLKFHRSQMDQIKQKILEKTMQIYESIDTDTFKAKKTALCNYCPYLEKCDFK